MHFSLCDLAADIAQNAAESGASVLEADIAKPEEGTVMLRASNEGNMIVIEIADDGKGMTESQLERAKDPFHTDGKKHPGRKVGLGVPFLIQTAAQSGGGWDIRSRPGIGTTVEASFDLGNIDAPPVGDVPGLLRTILLFEGPAEMVLRRSYNGTRGRTAYEVRKTELVEALGGLEYAGDLVLLDTYLRSLEEDDEETDET